MGDEATMTREQAERILAGQERIEAMLERLATQQQVKEWYTTEEFGRLVGKAEATIREYCRYGRLEAERRRSGRGPSGVWVLSHGEYLRYQREGLLPDRRAVSRRLA